MYIYRGEGQGLARVAERGTPGVTGPGWEGAAVHRHSLIVSIRLMIPLKKKIYMAMPRLLKCLSLSPPGTPCPPRYLYRLPTAYLQQESRHIPTPVFIVSFPRPPSQPHPLPIHGHRYKCAAFCGVHPSHMQLGSSICLVFSTTAITAFVCHQVRYVNPRIASPAWRCEVFVLCCSGTCAAL